MRKTAQCQNCGHAWKSHRFLGFDKARGECAGDNGCGCEQYLARPRGGGIPSKKRKLKCADCAAGKCHHGEDRCWSLTAPVPLDWICTCGRDTADPAHTAAFFHHQSDEEIHPADQEEEGATLQIAHRPRAYQLQYLHVAAEKDNHNA